VRQAPHLGDPKEKKLVFTAMKKKKRGTAHLTGTRTRGEGGKKESRMPPNICENRPGSGPRKKGGKAIFPPRGKKKNKKGRLTTSWGGGVRKARGHERKGGGALCRGEGRGQLLTSSGLVRRGALTITWTSMKKEKRKDLSSRKERKKEKNSLLINAAGEREGDPTPLKKNKADHSSEMGKRGGGGGEGKIPSEGREGGSLFNIRGGGN